MQRVCPGGGEETGELREKTEALCPGELPGVACLDDALPNVDVACLDPSVGDVGAPATSCGIDAAPAAWTYGEA